jgi:hypothetical protein
MEGVAGSKRKVDSMGSSPGDRSAPVLHMLKRAALEAADSNERGRPVASAGDKGGLQLDDLFKKTKFTPALYWCTVEPVSR